MCLSPNQQATQYTLLPSNGPMMMVVRIPPGSVISQSILFLVLQVCPSVWSPSVHRRYLLRSIFGNRISVIIEGAISEYLTSRPRHTCASTFRLHCTKVIRFRPRSILIRAGAGRTDVLRGNGTRVRWTLTNKPR